eukprot:Awhi_evm1s274
MSSSHTESALLVGIIILLFAGISYGIDRGQSLFLGLLLSAFGKIYTSLINEWDPSKLSWNPYSFVLDKFTSKNSNQTQKAKQQIPKNLASTSLLRVIVTLDFIEDVNKKLLSILFLIDSTLLFVMVDDAAKDMEVSFIFLFGIMLVWLYNEVTNRGLRTQTLKQHAN